jgi:Na+-translocating ferredoxin:NAD+ oxidoreductase subunit B
MPEPTPPPKTSAGGACPGAVAGPASSCGCEAGAVCPPGRSPTTPPSVPPSRRQFVGGALRGAFLFLLGAASTLMARQSRKERTVWQIDPNKCIACTNCANYCVLTPSAVKCVQHYPICGYCKLCTGYFEPQPNALNTAAENQVCPTGAIERKALEDPYYEYNIKEPLCIGCAKCVVGCVLFGNGSFALQVRHDRCVNCNECAIAMACPADAFVRLPASQPYLLKTREQSA